MIAPQYADLKKTATLFSKKYQQASPTPNIYLDNFFDEKLLKDVLCEFPDLQAAKDSIHYNTPNEDKLSSNDTAAFGKTTRTLADFLNSQPFLDFLQELSGIEEPLIADPDFEGGGFHETKKGGFLKMHIDFQLHKRLLLNRRLNLVIFLNEDWKEEFGGHFELWEPDMSQSAVKVLPVFNRVVLFSTNDRSWHGHPDPLNCPSNLSRKSLAFYYYTKGRPEDEVSTSMKDKLTSTFKMRSGHDSHGMKYYNLAINTIEHLLPASIILFIKRHIKR